MMNLEDAYKPDDVPPRIHQIVELAERFGALADEFEPWVPQDWETQDSVMAWFPKPPTERLITIGKDHAGGFYVLWCYDGRSPANAPVAYLGGEGEGNTVLSDSLDAFFELLGTGASWGPYDQHFYPPQDGDDLEEGEGPPAFRAHYRQEWGEPKAASAIRDAACAAHPDFETWVMAQCAVPEG